MGHYWCNQAYSQRTNQLNFITQPSFARRVHLAMRQLDRQWMAARSSIAILCNPLVRSPSRRHRLTCPANCEFICLCNVLCCCVVVVLRCWQIHKCAGILPIFIRKCTVRQTCAVSDVLHMYKCVCVCVHVFRHKQ